jgi:hypothetical protein
MFEFSKFISSKTWVCHIEMVVKNETTWEIHRQLGQFRKKACGLFLSPLACCKTQLTSRFRTLKETGS